ncbi:MAG: hypothetical protein CUN53_14845 [Phototrophicales bacterium]|nr:MAG: hypothetical protein CUN53_14845 [Phototrophicales bacterium]
MLQRVSAITDRLEHIWENRIMKRSAGSILAVIYLVLIGIIELNRQRLFPEPLANLLPTNHFFAVEITFTVLLLTEVISLVFALTRSFSRSIGVQLEILSLILLRDTFKYFTTFSEPLEWEQVSESIMPMLTDAIGALTIFVIVSIYYRIQKSRPLGDDLEQKEFIAYKKLIALGMLAVFILIGAVDLVRFAQGLSLYPFFETFYTVLIFTDVLMVLLSLRYSIKFTVTFRNFSFAVVTVFIRLALIAPTLIAVLMGIGTGVFALAVSYAYNYNLRIQKTETAEQRQID